MKKLFYLLALVIMTGACTGNKAEKDADSQDSLLLNDSTLYGICGDGTSMHVLELVTAMNDTLYLNVIDEDPEIDQYEGTVCLGGMMAGDRMAATGKKLEDGTYNADRIINLTSMLGKWSNVARLFEIAEDGSVKSYNDVETGAWNSWRILNGQLLLNADTFDIEALDADMIILENTEYQYVFTRVKAENDDAAL